jgi:hypothetical protein
MGFAYYPDGDHDGKIELEPTVAWNSDTISAQQQDSNSSTGVTNPCVATATCPTPMYYEGSTFLGNWSDLTQSFGLDAYESLFGHPIGEWNGRNFSVRLNFDDDTYGQDIFYFCHVRVSVRPRSTLQLLRSQLVFVFAVTLRTGTSSYAVSHCRFASSTFILSLHRLDVVAADSSVHVGPDQATPGRGPDQHLGRAPDLVQVRRPARRVRRRVRDVRARTVPAPQPAVPVPVRVRQRIRARTAGWNYEAGRKVLRRLRLRHDGGHDDRCVSGVGGWPIHPPVRRRPSQCPDKVVPEFVCAGSQTFSPPRCLLFHSRELVVTV